MKRGEWRVANSGSAPSVVLAASHYCPSLLARHWPFATRYSLFAFTTIDTDPVTCRSPLWHRGNENGLYCLFWATKTDHDAWTPNECGRPPSGTLSPLSGGCFERFAKLKDCLLSCGEAFIRGRERLQCSRGSASMCVMTFDRSKQPSREIRRRSLRSGPKTYGRLEPGRRGCRNETLNADFQRVSDRSPIGTAEHRDPDALVRHGGMNAIQFEKGSSGLLVDESRLESLRTASKLPADPYQSGVLRKYADQVGSVQCGAVPHPGGKAKVVCCANI